MFVFFATTFQLQNNALTNSGWGRILFQTNFSSGWKWKLDFCGSLI